MKETLAIAAASMGFDAERLQTIAHNLANISTNGYKREILAKRAGSPAFDQYMRSPEISDRISSMDTRPGALRSTGNPLDLAIEGASFFEIKTPTGPMYTRGGAFQLDQQGQLVNQSGHPVMGTGGAIVLSTSTPIIDKLGRIFEKDVQVGQLRMVAFSDVGQLTYLGEGLYDGAKAAIAETQEADQLRQGYVEASNVSSMHEMVRMIETLRHFESMQKVVQALDSSHDTVISKLGQF